MLLTKVLIFGCVTMAVSAIYVCNFPVVEASLVALAGLVNVYSLGVTHGIDTI